MSWYPRVSIAKLNFYRDIPKVDLHRHLEGSLRIDTLLEIGRQHGLVMPDGDIHALVQMQPGDRLDFSTFLSKFQTLRQFYRSPEVIERVTREAVLDCAVDGIEYLELRFTPVALGRLQGYSAARVMDWVVRSARQAASEARITVRLVASINRHEPVELAEEVARLAAERIDAGIVGLDLAGNEAQFPAAPFSGVLREARESGLQLSVHAGEWGPAENVRAAIENFQAARIGHGVRVLEDPSIVSLARERGVVFEVCITSNYQSGVVPALSAHPLPRMLNAGLAVALGSDDPSISSITLSDEYRLAVEHLGIEPDALASMIRVSARAAFLPAPERDALEAGLSSRLAALRSGWPGHGSEN